MKTNKILKVMCTVVTIILLVCISFIGIYITDKNQRVNVVKDYTLGMDLGGTREIILSPSDEKVTKYYDTDGNEVDVTDLSDEEKESYVKKEEPVNAEDVLNAENYLAAKEVFQKRLNDVGIQEFIFSVNEETGDIVLRTAETDTLDNTIYSIFETGKFELVDSETGEVLLNNSQVKDARVGYYTTTSGTTIYLTIDLNKEGTKKLEEISTVYVETQDEEGNSTKKTVTLSISGEVVTTTYFAEQIKTGQIQLTIGNTTTDTSTLQAYVLQAGNSAATLNSGASPIQYEMQTNMYVGTMVTDHTKIIALCTAVVAVAVMMAYMIAEHKDRGIIASVTFIGYIAALLLLIRYTNTVLTMESIMAIILSVIFNYAFLNILLKQLNHYKENGETPKSVMNKTILKSLFALIPALIIAVVFCFINTMSLNSFGIAIFWGIAMFIVYTFVITKTLLLNFEYLFEE